MEKRRKIRLFLCKNKPNFKNIKFGVSSFETSKYEILTAWRGEKTNPIQSQFKPNQSQFWANFKGEQSQTKPIQTQFQKPISAPKQRQENKEIPKTAVRLYNACLFICSLIHSLDILGSFGSISTNVYSSLARSFKYSGANFGKYIISAFFAALTSCIRLRK